MTTSELKINRDILLATKTQHLAERRAKTPLEAVHAMATMQRRPRYILNTVVDAHASVQLIGQITRLDTYDPVAMALRFVREGVDAVAFFTDNAAYQNDLDDLLMVAMGVKDTPVIYQNYIVNEYNVIEARASDASALVLYASALDPAMLRKTVSMTQRWKMTAIVQVNSEDEMRRAVELSPHAIAIGLSESDDIPHAIDKLRLLRPLLPYNTRSLLMNCLHTLDEVEAVVAEGVNAVIVSEDVLNTAQKSTRLKALLQRA